MGQQVVRLNWGEPDNDSADNINECAIANIKSGNTHYCDPQGVIRKIRLLRRMGWMLK